MKMCNDEGMHLYQVVVPVRKVCSHCSRTVERTALLLKGEEARVELERDEPCPEKLLLVFCPSCLRTLDADVSKRYTPRADKYLRELAKRVYLREVFISDFIQWEDYATMLSSVFLPLIFGGVHLYNYLQYNHITCVYEEYDKAGPRGINGYPMFSSCQMLNIDDHKKLLTYLKKYEAAFEAVDEDPSTNQEKESK
jgi:hypothetical protein